ncbi:MAG: prepilin-type N-terminal cleavage/methylation domain-containing protein [Acidobacteriota bacterium]|nr:prepilin-type N-terminal cleavage/methylation domain-containing protein [Acidobacteriota bacterium]MDH3529075.1 prepilin-type N-terminal cleavage/methylation domain-containing protein [Acidobacteriota bacterium]
MEAGIHNQRGFSLIECMFALVITVIGLSAVLGLVVSAINLQSYSQDSNAANSIAKSKVEELRNFSPSATERDRGGSLTSNAVNYSDTPDPRFRRRWQIEVFPTDAGVPEGTQRVTVAILSNRPDVVIGTVQIQVLIPGS